MATTPVKDIPSFRIDLAKPPELRYLDLAAEFGPTLQGLGHVFDELLESMLGYKWLARVAKAAAALCLRGVADAEQSAEIRGFAQAAGVELFLVVALNVFLDVMMGCTAGCARVDGDDGSRGNLMQFRTLDWCVDPLRDLTVALEYVDTSTGSDEVVATSVTYAGFMGVLTGVKKGLSLSLNYRPIHLCKNWPLRQHWIWVILGFRPSISSVLRDTLLGPLRTPIEDYARELANIPSSPCYLTLSDGDTALVVEKDLTTARIRTGTDFIVQTNHDDCTAKACAGTRDAGPVDEAAVPLVPHNELWLADSSDRMDVMLQKWRAHRGETGQEEDEEDEGEEDGEKVCKYLTKDTLVSWMRDERISNRFTHFACIMNPATGKLEWLERGPDPATFPPFEQQQQQ